MTKILSLFLILTTQLNANLFEKYEQDLFKQSHKQYRSFVPLKQPSKVMFLGEGSVSGALYEASSNEPISDAALLKISLIGRIDETDSWGFVSSIDVLNSNYSFNELADGQYYIRAYSRFLIDQEDRPLYVPTLWNENNEIIRSRFDLPNESIITVVDGETVENIDFHLIPAAILAITDDVNNGEALSDLVVINSDNQFSGSTKVVNNVLVGNVSTSATYLYNYFPVGDYRFAINSEVEFYNARNYVDYLYGKGECYSCALELMSGKGKVVTLQKFEKKIIDITRSEGASISGVLTFEESENDLEFYSFINLVGTHGNSSHFVFLEDEFNESGEYHISGIAAGEYSLYFNRYGYMRTQYKNYDCPSFGCKYYDSYPIRVSVGGNLTNINMQLKKGLRVFGSIVDNVTNENLIEDETPFALDNYVQLYDKDLNIVGIGFNRFQAGNSYTTRHGIPEGEYYVRTGSSISNESNNLYVNQVYPGIECEGIICDFSQAELISLNSNTDVSGIDFRLNRAKFISGKVIDDGGTGIENISVAVLNQQGDFVSFAKTDEFGIYKVGGLKSGSYFLRTYNGNMKLFKFDPQKINTANSWVNKIYPNQDCTNDYCNLDPDKLIQIGDNNVENLDLVLDKGVSLSGQVKNSLRGIGIQDIEIKIFSESGDYIESYFTDEYGYFATAAIQPGNYKLVTANQYHYVNQAYGGIDCGLKECDVSTSTLVTVTESNIDNVNFNLLAGQDYYPQLSGLWYNPEQSGHGLQVEVIKLKGKASLLVSWYVIHNGQPIWLTGTGPLNKDIAYVDLQITNGANFPPNFNAQDVEKIDWGLLKLDFSGMNNVEVSWQTEVQGFNNGSLSMQRLTNLSLYQNNNDSIDACFSGTFYNADESGHGVMIEVLGENANSMVVTWFVYNEGEQFWLLASGAVQGNTATLPAIYTSGTNFPPNFDVTQLQRNDWGELKVFKEDNNNLRLEWNPNSQNQSFGSGSINMTRLTNIEGLVCNN